MTGFPVMTGKGGVTSFANWKSQIEQVLFLVVNAIPSSWLQ